MAWVAGIAGIGTQAIGNEQQRQATLSGAHTQANIEALNRQYQRTLFDEQQGYQEPYYRAGVAALPMLEQYRTQGGMDLSQNPIYQMQQREGGNALAAHGYTRPETAQYFNRSLNAAGQQPAYNRLLDLQRVGMGAAETAGNYATGQGNALASSYARGGNAMAQGVGMAGNQRQSLWGNAAAQVGQMPAYYDYLRRTGG